MLLPICQLFEDNSSPGEGGEEHCKTAYNLVKLTVTGSASGSVKDAPGGNSRAWLVVSNTNTHSQTYTKHHSHIHRHTTIYTVAICAHGGSRTQQQRQDNIIQQSVKCIKSSYNECLVLKKTKQNKKANTRTHIKQSNKLQETSNE